MDRPEGSLPIAKLNYERNPCLASVSELCDTYADNCDYTSARKLLAAYLGLRTDVGPARGLADIVEKIDEVPGPEENRDGVRALVERLALKRYEAVFTLSPVLLPDSSRQEAQRLGYVQFAIYPDSRNQRIEYKVVDAVKVEESTDRAGNRRLKVWFGPDVSPRLVMMVTMVPEGFDLRRTEQRSEDIPDNVRCYLGQTPLIDPMGERAVSLARQLKGADRFKTLKNIDSWFHGFKYEGPSQPGSETALRERRACCWDCSRATVAILRAMGIPARQIYTLGLQHLVLKLPLNPTLGGHFLSEFYDPVYGWVVFSPRYTVGMNAPARPLTEAAEDCIRLVAEDPDETWPDGTCALQYSRMWYGWNTDADGASLVNSDIRLIGLSLGEPEALPRSQR